VAELQASPTDWPIVQACGRKGYAAVSEVFRLPKTRHHNAELNRLRRVQRGGSKITAVAHNLSPSSRIHHVVAGFLICAAWCRGCDWTWKAPCDNETVSIMTQTQQ